MTLYCAVPPSNEAINALLTDTTYLYRWSDNIDEEINNNNNYYYNILKNDSIRSTGNSTYQQSRTFSGFHTSVNFKH